MTWVIKSAGRKSVMSPDGWGGCWLFRAPDKIANIKTPQTGGLGMRFIVAIEPGTETTAFGIVIPDLPGCFSAGDTLDEALDNACEAIELYYET
jgi:hypothetical protein